MVIIAAAAVVIGKEVTINEVVVAIITNEIQ